MLVSLLALFYARKNLKMQKYIDVVTAQRIKWIGELRADFSAILSHMFTYQHLQMNWQIIGNFAEMKILKIMTMNGIIH